MQSVPPLSELFKQAGMELPDFLGKDIDEALAKSREEAVKTAAEEMAEGAEDANGYVEVVNDKSK